MKILIVNGPNLNLLGQREPEIYGNRGFESYLQQLRAIFPAIEIQYQQSNIEGELVGFLQAAEGSFDGVLLNAAAYSHTSIALADAVAAISVPVVEVHISNVFAREAFRHHSYISKYCKGMVAGFGLDSYQMGIYWFLTQALRDQ
jgi:3-dehydroquinate dehydratase-2